jgi:hypothetical protein
VTTRTGTKPEPWVFEYRRLALVAVYLAFLLEATAAFGGTSLLNTLCALTEASAIVLWCTLDAEIHGKMFIRSYAWTMMFTWPLGIVVYLLWTRRSRGLLSYLIAVAAATVVGFTGIGLAVAFKHR